MRARLCWAVGITINVIACSLLHGRTWLTKSRYNNKDNAKNRQITPNPLIKNAFIIVYKNLIKMSE